MIQITGLTNEQQNLIGICFEDGTLQEFLNNAVTEKGLVDTMPPFNQEDCSVEFDGSNVEIEFTSEYISSDKHF